MRFLARVIAVLAVVLGIGLYRGWFHIASNDAAGSSNVTLTVDNNKMREDKNKVIDKAEDLEHRTRSQAAAAIGKNDHPTTQSTGR